MTLLVLIHNKAHANIRVYWDEEAGFDYLLRWRYFSQRVFLGITLMPLMQ